MNPNILSINDLGSIARKIRSQVVQLSHQTGAAHLGSALSCTDILVALYWGVLNIDPTNPQSRLRDRFILSKGHAATVLYVVLAEKGFISKDTLSCFANPGSCLAEHPIPYSVPGLELATGSLGHGLSVGIGMALAGRILQLPYRVFIVISDGECNEGSVWEAALFAPVHQLNNIVVIIDYNKWQATGRSEEVMSLNPLVDKWKSFGWQTYEINGHNIQNLVDVLSQVPDGNGKPIAIIAHTIKGKGISFMEDNNNWHYRIPDEDEVKRALIELG